ncbi:MAG: hypothetical protein U5R31_14805 [Acidimicrobiia bacterium]|nr:hypothetical protein [Acidimicrobiia bacterium]
MTAANVTRGERCGFVPVGLDGGMEGVEVDAGEALEQVPGPTDTRRRCGVKGTPRR